MKVLVAAKRTQGRCPTNFSFTRESEMVRFTEPHDGEAVEGECGCLRSMDGLETGCATTTMLVEERTLTIEQYFETVLQSSVDLIENGYTVPDVREEVETLAEIAAQFPTRTVIERRGIDIFLRRIN